jgi:uncharacterized protein with von Willebrand factor type A (vWA) domain
MLGWRVGLIFRLLHRFSDPAHLRDQQADEEWRQYLLRETGDPCEAPGEPERQELLRLLEEEIASVREEFAYAEKANEERAAIERDACLAPEGETWRMMLRQEAALDRSIDRKVRILLRLRKEATNPRVAPAGEDDGVRMGNIDEPLDIVSDKSQRMEAVKHSKMKEQFGNVLENKGSCLDGRARSCNVTENKGSYAQNPGISLKTKGIVANAELNPTGR